MDTDNRRLMSSADAQRILRERVEIAMHSGEAVDVSEFAHCRLANTKLTISSMVVRASFHDSELTRVDFQGSNLDGMGFGAARLQNCDMSNLPAARLYGEKASFERCRFYGTYLRHAHLKGARLEGCDLTQADLAAVFAVGASFRASILEGTSFDLAWLEDTDFNGANCRNTVFRRAHLRNARFSDARLQGADFSEADLRGADFAQTDLSGVRFAGADLRGASLAHTQLVGADLSHANFSGADLSHADLSGASVYGASAWDVRLDEASQDGLVIAPPGQSPVTVDDLEVAQFVYLLSHNPKIRRVIDTITSRAALILGRFTPERKAVLDAIREDLRRRDWVPIMFDFDKPTQRDFTETILTLAGMSRFVIVDITNPSSSPLELQATVPNYMIPFVPIIQEGERPFAMFQDLQRKHADWVLEPLVYDSIENLRRGFEKAILVPALEKHAELMARRNRTIATRDIRRYL
jgi:uncharacterized protein YjbI with pentapeptide repeats